jgi:hypothetical protein
MMRYVEYCGLYLGGWRHFFVGNSLILVRFGVLVGLGQH